jgi:hypothetical protein
LLYYRSGNRDPLKYWNDEAKRVYNEFKDLIKPDADQKAAALQAIADAKTDDGKIEALTMAVRKRLRNFVDPEVTAAERDDFIKKLPRGRQRTSAEIFKSGIALPAEMNVVFAALASQAGVDVRPALVASRTEVFIDPKSLADRYFADSVEMAARAGDSWKIFGITEKGLFPGMLPAQEEGMFAIVTDPKAAILMTAPVSRPEGSAEIRNAKLKLSASGTLTGDVDEGYTGHSAEVYRSQFAGQSAAQVETWFHDRLIRMFPDADITSLKVEHVGDALKPLQVSYHMEAPYFAQVTGKRMLFEPNAFRRSQAAPFSASERRYPVQFPFSWKEIDQIHIELPEGFELESPDSPGGLNFGDAGSYNLTMTVQKGRTQEVLTSREFVFGAKGLLQFGVPAYPTLKKVFDEIQLRDTHALSVKGN